MGDMVHGRYGTCEIWYMEDMVHRRYGTWEMWCMCDMVHMVADSVEALVFIVIGRICS